MKRMKRNDIEKMLGYPPTKEILADLLKKMRETGQSPQQIIGEGKFLPIMPATGILDDSGRFEYQGKMITYKEWKKINPLGEYGRIVIIGTKERNEKHRELCNES